MVEEVVEEVVETLTLYTTPRTGAPNEMWLLFVNTLVVFFCCSMLLIQVRPIH